MSPVTSQLKVAVATVESLCARVTTKEGDGDPALPYTYSGGTCSSEDIAPALFSSEERAIRSWLAEVLSKVTKDHLEWTYPPEMLKYQITMADAKQRHRVVSDRYTVKSQFVIHKETNG